MTALGLGVGAAFNYGVNRTLEHLGLKKSEIVLNNESTGDGVGQGDGDSAENPEDANRSLPRDEHGNLLPDTDAPHSRLGPRTGRNGEYRQG